MTMLHLFFSAKGRISRAKYILATLLWMLVLAFCIFAFIYFTDLSSSEPAWIVTPFFLLPGTWSLIVLGIKRLHDRNKTGWWMVPVWLVPSMLDRAASIAERGGNLILQIICIVISVAVAVWIFVEFFCLRGTIGPNQYGDDPVTQDISPA
jgi:uncharacterized membrane protein YhaH (DUF805 family)